MKNIYLLGATGSIGTQVLDVISELGGYRIMSISIGRNIERGIEIIKNFSPEYVSVLEKEDAERLKALFPNLDIGYGEASITNAATYSSEPGLLINAVVGMVGLLPTIAAIKKRRDILLANKETLVVAGDIITSLVNKYQVKLMPIDSEHSAILQCLQGRSNSEVKRIIITASGGSFRELSRAELANVTIADALKHPNWSMGKKITIDSATMVNKGLEVIEAHYLFGIDYDRIETVIHPESIIHSMVEFQDNSLIAQLSIPDMRIPIQYALTHPHKLPMRSQAIDFKTLSQLNFMSMDFKRFPLLMLAYQVGKRAGNLPVVYNSSNEVAVELFLNGEISFLEIEQIIFDAVESVDYQPSPSIDEIIAIATKTRKTILDKYRK